MVPVVRTDRARAMPVERRHANPLATRMCLIFGVMLLMVPIALSLRADNRQVVRAAGPQRTETISVANAPPPPAPTDASLAPDTSAPTTIVVITAAPITPAPTVAAVATPAPTEPPTEPPTTAAKPKTAIPKPATTVAQRAAATPSVAKAVCAQTYTIAKGDAWSSIAARAKVTMNALLAANGATIKTVLLPGNDICLPQGAVAPGPPSTKPPATTQPATTQPKAAPATTQPKPTTTQPKPTTTQPKTPPVTTVPATTQPAPPANTFSKAEVAQIIRDVWPDNLEDEAIVIATRESGLVPTVKNYCCYGLFQIYYTVHKAWLAGIGITSAAQLYDPRTNATAALALYNRSGGWAPWAVPTTTTVPV